MPQFTRGDGGRWGALAVVLVAAFMQLVDVSIVNVAIPSIERELAASYASIQLVVAIYSLAYAVLLITGGRLGDIYGRRRLFLVGLVGFVLSSAACGLAPGVVSLIVARAVQGLFASLLFPQVLAILQVMFTDRRRAAAFGALGATSGLATIAGPVLGGLLIEWDLFGLDWRLVFLVNVVLGVPAFLLAWRLLPESRSPTPLRLDPWGVALVGVALFLLVFPLVWGREAGWPWWAFAGLGLGAFGIALFGWYEHRRTVRGESALVDTRLFHDRAFDAGLFVAFFFTLGFPPFFFVFTIFLQFGLGYSPLHAGLTTLPFAAGAATGSALSIPIVKRLGRGVLSIGSATAALGMAGVWLTVRLTGIAFTSYDGIPALALAGIGVGFVISPLFNIVLAGVAPTNAGSASGVLTTVQRVGAAVGFAVVGVLFFALLEAKLPGAESGARALGGAVTPERGRAFAGALMETLWFEIADFALVFFLVLLLPKAERRAPGRLQPSAA